MKQLLEILRPARETLEELYMEEYAMEIEEDASKSPLREPIIFKNLKVLSLKYSIPDTEHLFLESVRLPALVDLTLTCTAGLGDEHYDLEIYFSLIHHFPLQQIERLALIKTMFPLDDRLEVVSLHLGDDETQCMHWYCSEAPTLRGIAPICGNRTTLFFMFFLHQFASLKHLHIRDAIGLKEMMSPFWKWGVSSTLETLHLDGCPEWLLELMQSVEDDRKSESRLQVSIGESLRSALSEEEKEKLDRHIKTLSEL